MIWTLGQPLRRIGHGKEARAGCKRRDRQESGAESLRDLLTQAGAKSIGEDTFETLRLEAGIARYGVDMDESNVVTETNLDDAISFTNDVERLFQIIRHGGNWFRGGRGDRRGRVDGEFETGASAGRFAKVDAEAAIDQQRHQSRDQ